MPKVLNDSYEQLVEKAQKIFWLKGFKGVSVKELAEYLNVSQTVLYNKYSKDALFLDSLDYYTSNYSDPFLKRLKETTDGLGSLRDFDVPGHARCAGPRRLDGARRSGSAHRAREAGGDDHWQPLPAPTAARQDRHDARPHPTPEPSWRTKSMAPAFCGVDPLVRTTVAKTQGSPSLDNLTAS